MSFLSNWGPPTPPMSVTPPPLPNFRKLSRSDENTPPESPGADEKTSQSVKNILKTSGEGKVLLKTSRDNIPAAASLPTILAPELKTDELTQKIELSQRFEKLKKDTAILFSQLQIKYANPAEVDGRFPQHVQCVQETRLTIPNSTMYRPLHANHVNIKGYKVICTQSPKENSYLHFWLTVTDTQAFILDLCNEKDFTALPPVTRYYPTEENKTFEQQGVLIKFISSKDLAKNSKMQFTANQYEVTKWGQTHTATRISYSSWNDFEDIKIEDLCHLVDKVRELSKDSSLIIHCRAGVGRTGTVTVALALRNLHENAELKGMVDNSGLSDTIDHLITIGRQQRGALFVSSLEQYILLHKYAEHLLKQPTP